MNRPTPSTTIDSSDPDPEMLQFGGMSAHPAPYAPLDAWMYAPAHPFEGHPRPHPTSVAGYALGHPAAGPHDYPAGDLSVLSADVYDHAAVMTDRPRHDGPPGRQPMELVKTGEDHRGTETQAAHLASALTLGVPQRRSSPASSASSGKKQRGRPRMEARDETSVDVSIIPFTPGDRAPC